MTDRPITGADLVHQLWTAARAAGVSMPEYIRPLTSLPSHYIGQLRRAACPKPATIARVQALIEGRELPPRANQPKNAGDGNDRAAAATESKAQLEWRRALAEAAAARRLPGETLHAAVHRVEAELRAA